VPAAAREVSTNGYGRIEWSDEAEVVAQLRAGDHAAFERIFLAYYSSLAGYAASVLRDDTLAEDITQSVLIRLWTNRQGLELHTSLGAYLFRATRNRALNTMRDAARHHTNDEAWTSEAIGSVLVEQPFDDEHADWAANLTRIEAAVATLSPRCREVFTLRWRQGLRYSDVAALLGISIKTVETQMTAALKAIRKIVGRTEPL
jgi:RNA polymerase sigma-70 factor (ECF subfamily)